MMHLKTNTDSTNPIEFRNRLRANPGRTIARAATWLLRRAIRATRVYRTKQILRGLRDEELRDIGLTRSEVERAG
jgi:uncharacterized protein YjiS (DUF1127 family)